jgi:glutaredoxin 2
MVAAWVKVSILLKSWMSLVAPERVIHPKTDITAILECIDSACLAVNCLLFLRSIAIGLPELATQSARDYFQVRKENDD